MKSIITVCVGNICRSPMAAGLLETEFPNLDVSSAGISALIGHPADLKAQALMADRGIDISQHRAKQLNQVKCKQADILLVMEVGHKKYIEQAYPFTRGKVFLLNDKAVGGIPDPYMLSIADFQASLSLIEEGTKKWAEKLRKLVNEGDI